MKLLMITRKVDRNEHLAGFIYNWVKKLAGQVDELKVISWQEGDSSGLPDNVKVTHLKTSQNKLLKLVHFKLAIWKNLKDVDGVFCHQMPIYTIVAAPLAKVRGKKVVSWYMHKQVDFKMRLMTFLANSVLSASKESFRLKTSKLIATGHGIDTELFNNKEKKQNNNFEIITVGRISPTKDYESIIKAVADVENVNLTIIGEPGLTGQRGYLAALQQMIEKLNIRSRIKFLGSKPNTQIPEFLKKSDLFINMSGTGSIDKAVLEAMAAGCLVLTSNESFKDILSEEYKVEANNPRQLAEKIKYLTGLSLEERIARGVELRKIVLENHNLDNLVKKYMNISIVIPIYNEQENIPFLFNKLKGQNGYEWEAILVNDGSTDGSREELEKIANQDSRIKVINFRKNYGQTAAMQAGFDNAKNEVIVPMDGDLQNDPADIEKLLQKISEGYEVVSGWRKDRKDKKLSRIIPSKIANWLISKITKVNLHDYGCSLKAYKRDILQDVRLYGEMHRFIPAYAAWHGAKVTEIVVSHHPRKFGVTKYGISRTLKVVLDLITVKFLISYSTKPMHFFGSAGIWSFIFSGLASVLAFYWKFAGQKDFIETPLPIVAIFFFLVGMQFLLMGLIAEMITRNYHESSDRKIYDIKNKINL